MSSSRLATFDLLKLFAIFLVVWGHCIQYFQTEIFYNQPVYRIIYSFHMPLFMAIVGFFSTKLSSLSISKIILKKLTQLIIPSISTGLIIWIAFIREFSVDCFLNLLLNNMWFLKSAFLCCILYSFTFIFENKNIKLIYLFVSILLSQIITLYNLPIMYPCFLLGAYLHKIYPLKSGNLQLINIISFLIFLILLLFWDSSFWQHNDVITPISVKIFNRVYRIAIGYAGTIFFISLFELYHKKILNTEVGKLMCDYGKFTLGIYILQTIIVEILLSSYINLDNINFITYNFILTPFIALLVIFTCLFLIKIISKSKILSFLILGKYQNFK